MLNWDVISKLSIQTADVGWSFLQSNFSTSVIGSLAGAYGGAWAAQKIAERTKLREEKIRTIRNANAAGSMAYSIANTHIGLKKQHVKDLWESFHKNRKLCEDFIISHKNGTNKTNNQFNFEANLLTLNPPHTPLAQIEKIVFDQLSPDASLILIINQLSQSLQNITYSINARNELIEFWRNNRPNEFEFTYFGFFRENNAIDQRYMTLIDAIYNSNDDVIAFSIMTGDALHEYALEQKRRYRDLFRKASPSINKMQFDESKSLLPDPKQYESFGKMLGTKTPK